MLITVEGIDGSGKSSAIEALEDAIPEAVFTAEPTNSWYGQAVSRSISETQADPLAELFLYMADHADHLSRVVTPALDSGEIVISDRFSDSRFAYQGATLAAHLEDPITYIESLHQPWSPRPDLTIYLDVSPEVGAHRSGSTNKFERTTFLRAVSANYEQLISANSDRFYRIDANQSQSAVTETVIKVVTAAVSEASEK